MLALEPPGNAARDLAIFRRSLFAASGEGSCLFLPEVVPLAFFSPPASSGTSLSDLRLFLDELWDGVEGDFSSGSIIASNGVLYLECSGPVDVLAARLLEAARGSERCPYESAPFEAGRGFFLCLAPESVPVSLPPRLSFRDCSIALLRLSFGEQPFEAASWREIARSKRRTGPSTIPSQRRRQ